jgi:hypothetical protein
VAESIHLGTRLSGDTARPGAPRCISPVGFNLLFGSHGSAPCPILVSRISDPGDGIARHLPKGLDANRVAPLQLPEKGQHLLLGGPDLTIDICDLLQRELEASTSTASGAKPAAANLSNICFLVSSEEKKAPASAPASI